MKNKNLEIIYEQIIRPWIAAGPGGFSITPLVYQGLIAGSEFLVYDVNKLYLAINNLFTATSDPNTNSGQSTITIYNEANAATFGTRRQIALYDSTGATALYSAQDILQENIYFSRFTFGARYAHYKFIGYRINRV